MSDPVTNAEVEDVLSSIRRLVSEDRRPVQAPKAAARTDRLVLTPALRISTPDEDDPVTDQSAAAQPLQDDVGEDQHRKKGGYSISSLITDDEAIETYASPDDEVAEADLDDMSDISAEAEENPFDDPAHDYTADPYNFDDEDDVDGEEEISVLTSYDVPEVAQDDDVTFDDDAELSQTAHLTRDHRTAAEDYISVAEETPGNQPENDTSADTDGHDQKSIVLTAKIAALETAIDQIADTWEPDEAGEGDYAGTEAESMEWQDDEQSAESFFRPSHAEVEEAVDSKAQEPEPAPQAPDAEPAGDAKPEPRPNEALDFAGDEQLLDEDALRDLISDIVRSELQGALGERITRNVRKLVRREIHRALTAHDLE